MTKKEQNVFFWGAEMLQRCESWTDLQILSMKCPLKDDLNKHRTPAVPGCHGPELVAAVAEWAGVPLCF